MSNYFSDECNLKSEDSDTIKELWQQYQLQSENQAMRIVLSRYLRSIEMRDHVDRIIDMIIAFEALLIKN